MPHWISTITFGMPSRTDHEQFKYDTPSSFHYKLPVQITSHDQEQSHLIRNARNDLFKHFRMSASLRAMKRGDGILSEHFSLDSTDTLQSDEKISFLFKNQTLTLIEVDSARKAREDMHHHFWTAHQARKEIADNKAASEAQIDQKKSRPHAVHPDKHRIRAPLPSKLDDLYHDFCDQSRSLSMARAIAITETHPPFKIVDVNKAWVGLCGYSRNEAIGSTLKLLQGPKTNMHAANDLVSSLLARKKRDDGKSGEYETVLTNYRSDGKMFKNHIRVGLLRDDAGKVVNFVGVFKRLDDDDEVII